MSIDFKSFGEKFRKEKIISVLTDNTDSIILQEITNRITSVSDDIQTIYLRKGLTDEKL